MLLRVTTVAIIYFLSSANGVYIRTPTDGITGGELVYPRQFTYHALIGCVNNSNGDDKSVEWICNGAIINNRFVATLASCVDGCNKFKIRVGTTAHKDSRFVEGHATEYFSKPGTMPNIAPGFIMGEIENDLATNE